ncbi:MAG: LysR family transcriptional regulator [Vagococcus sp.]
MFKLLITFRVAYETRNFSQAADQLFISQPAVSNQMKQLEEELDCMLFVRKGKQEMYPTEFADILYSRLLNLSDDWQETLRLIHGKEKEKITCRISASNTFSVYYLPELMEYLLPQFPRVTFELEMKNSEEVLENIQKHRAHFGFIEKPLVTEQVDRVSIESDELVLAGDLDSELWLSREDTSGVYHYMETYFLEHNIQPEKIFIKNNEMIVKFLEKGIGKSIVSKRAISDSIPYESLGKTYERLFYFLKKEHLIEEYVDIAKAICQFYQ